jgi:hypothetical protein
MSTTSVAAHARTPHPVRMRGFAHLQSIAKNQVVAAAGGDPAFRSALAFPTSSITEAM